MSAKVNYIISNYLGTRRYSPKLDADPLYYVRKQYDYFKSKYIPHLEAITFVLNKSTCKERDDKFISFVNNIDLEIDINLLIRENNGFSYGAWQDAILKNIDYDYSFLSEDDYIPNDVDFIRIFMDALDDKTIYVCPFYTDHCAISIGLLNNKILKELLKENSHSPLNIIDCGSDYGGGCHNQRLFLQNFVDSGYTINDLSMKHNVSFSNHLGEIQNYGNKEGALIFKSIA